MHAVGLQCTTCTCTCACACSDSALAQYTCYISLLHMKGICMCMHALEEAAGEAAASRHAHEDRRAYGDRCDDAKARLGDGGRADGRVLYSTCGVCMQGARLGMRCQYGASVHPVCIIYAVCICGGRAARSRRDSREVVSRRSVRRARRRRGAPRQRCPGTPTQRSPRSGSPRHPLARSRVPCG